MTPGRSVNANLKAVTIRLLWLSTFCLCVPAGVAAQHAPLPDRLRSARTTYLVNNSGDIKAYDRFYQEIAKWTRFVIVGTKESSDLVFVLSTTDAGGVVFGTGTATTTGGVTTGSTFGIYAPSEKLYLHVIDWRTGEVLVRLHRKMAPCRSCAGKTCLKPQEANAGTREFTVERLFDMTGNTVVVVTPPTSALRLPTPADRPAVRALSA
jgi:hypothetical protein